VRREKSRVDGENPGWAGRIKVGRGESRVRRENPMCAGRIQCARGESSVRGENPGCAGRIQGRALIYEKISHFTMVNCCLPW
jgi:hypothetical protein